MAKILVDPVKAAEKFQADMAAMNVGRKEDGGTPKQRARVSDFGVLEYKFPRYSLELTDKQTLQDALDPVFLSDIADKIIGGDKTKPQGRGRIIEVRRLDIGLFAELLITETGPGFVRTKLLRSTESGAVELPKDCPLEIQWNAGTRLHDVIRKAGKQVLRSGFQTQDGAAEWIADHLKAMAA